jgi:hypothetical protein
MMDSAGQSVVIARDGTVAAAWSEADRNSTGVPGRVLFSERPPGGAWGAPQPVTPEMEDMSADTHLGIDATGRVVLAFPTGSAIDVMTRPPNGNFGPLRTIQSTPPGGINRCVMTMDSTGNAVLVWAKVLAGPGEDYQLQWSVMRPDGTSTTPKVLDEVVAGAPGTAARIDLFSLANDAHGTVYAVWEHSYQDAQHPENSMDSIEGATVHDGADFSAPVTLARANGGTQLEGPRVSADSDGDVLAAWQALPPSGPGRIQATLASAGSLQGPVVTLPQPDGTDAEMPATAITSSGEGEVLWRAGAHSESGDTIWATRWRRGAQPDPPAAIGVGFVPVLAAGDGPAMLATWAGPNTDYQSNPLVYSFRGQGGAFPHAQPLTSAVVDPDIPALAVDSAGDAAVVWTNFADAIRSANYAWATIYDAGGPVGGSASRSSAGRFIRAFSMSRRRFRVGRHATAKSAGGSAFRYRLAGSSRVRIRITTKRSGVRVGRKCRAAARVSHSRRRHKRCTYYSAAGSLLRHGRAGRNRTAFSGRLGRRRLRPGVYRATLTAARAPGSRRVSFRIVRDVR